MVFAARDTALRKCAEWNLAPRKIDGALPKNLSLAARAVVGPHFEAAGFEVRVAGERKGRADANSVELVTGFLRELAELHGITPVHVVSGDTLIAAFVKAVQTKQEDHRVTRRE